MPESINFPRGLPEPGNIDRVHGVGHQSSESEKRRFARLLEKEEGKGEEEKKEEEGEREMPSPASGKERASPKEKPSPNGRGRFIDVTI